MFNYKSYVNLNNKNLFIGPMGPMSPFWVFGEQWAEPNNIFLTLTF